MELGYEQMNASITDSPVIKKIPTPLDVRIIQVKGGYTINKHGDEFYPLEVCVTLGEVLGIISKFFQNEKEKPEPQVTVSDLPSEDKTNEETQTA